MAAKKKKKAKKAKAVKKSKKKAPARKAAGKKAKKAPARKRKTAAKAKKKAPARKPAKKSKAKKKQIVGEGDYQASRAFLKDQSSFVEKNRNRIPALGEAAERALDGPEGDSLRAAEATAADRSRDTY